MKRAQIYIHIPFCESKCRYCDFYSVTDKDRAGYITALCGEIKKESGKLSGREISSVYIGGGTPGILSEEEISAVFAALGGYKLKEDAEITIECNPGAIETEKFRLYKKLGINRISFGVQSALDDELKTLGRIHSFADAERSVKSALDAEIENISCDIMFALPGQTREKLFYSLEKISSLPVKHISFYALTLEEGTPLWRERDKYIFPDDEEQRDFYLSAVKYLSEKGFLQYEISNFAIAGFESRHNTGYWTGEEYIGFGAAAYSYLDGERYHNARDIEKYISGFCKETDEVIGEEEKKREKIIFGLRLSAGVDENLIISFKPDNKAKTERFISEGLMQRNGDRLRLSPEGFFISNGIINELI